MQNKEENLGRQGKTPWDLEHKRRGWPLKLSPVTEDDYQESWVRG